MRKLFVISICALSVLVLKGSSPVTPPPAARLVISQVYGGGGNANAVYTNDFIEIFNAGNAVADLTNMSVQYASASGTSWAATALSGTLAPGQYYLIREANGTGGTTPLPTPDATGSIAMAAGSGKVLLASVATALSTACPSTNVVDLVAYGGNCPNPAGSISGNVNSATRGNGGCTISGSNAADFTVSSAANPRNRSTQTHTCVAAGSPAVTISTTSPLPSGTVGTMYSTTIQATGGSGAFYDYSVTLGTLPPGLGLDHVSGVLSGMPTTTGTSNFTIQVTDSNAASGSVPYSLTVNGNVPLFVGTAALPSGTTSVAYMATLTATGGTGVYTNWIVTGGNLPDNLTLSAGGVISGSPTVAGIFTFTVQVTDNGAHSASRQLSISVGAPAVVGSVVINQVYGGGGNSGALWKSDFVELYNPTSTPVSLNGTSVQYAASTGASWQVTALSGTLLPGRYFLVKEGDGTGGTLALPNPDVLGGIAMAAGSGKVALSSSTSGLTGACPLGPAVLDFVGYGSANCWEGDDPAPTLDNATADFRTNGVDSDSNSVDFTGGSPNPRSSGPPVVSTVSLPPASLNLPYSATLSAAGGTGVYTAWGVTGNLPTGLNLNPSTGVISGTPTVSGSSSFTLQVTDSANNTGTSGSLSLTVTNGTCSATVPSIGAIQGTGNMSPKANTTVTTQGIVTHVKSTGFFIQDAGDGDPLTSDAVFVYTGAPLPGAAVVGYSVCVTGTVQDYIPLADPTSLPATEIAGNPLVVGLSAGNALPAPVVLTAAGTDPQGSLTQLEKYEGMRIQIANLTVTGPTGGSVNQANATASSNGIFFGTVAGIARPFREAGYDPQDPAPLPSGFPSNPVNWDGNPEVLQIYSPIGSPLDVTAGATVSNILGVLDFSSRFYTVLIDNTPTVSGNVTYTAVSTPVAGDLTIANFNMEHFYDTVKDPDPAKQDVQLTPAAFAIRLNKASLAIRNVLKTPDILCVEEMENLTTLQALSAKISADAVAAGQSDPQYAAYLVSGNDIGNINTGFLVKPSKVTGVTVTQFGKNDMFVSPTLCDTNGLNCGTSLIWDRPPLVLTGTASRGAGYSAMPITVVGVHALSLLSVDDNTPSGSSTNGDRRRAKRQAGAEWLANYLQSIVTPSLNLVVLGDFNAYEFNDGFVDVMGTIRGTPTPATQVVRASPDLLNPDLTDLLTLAPAGQRYSYTFHGSAEELDHIMVNPNMLARYRNYEVARNDADFPEAYRGDPNRPERLSDHDMPESYFTLPANQLPVATGQAQSATYGKTTTFALTANDPDGDTLTYHQTAAAAKGLVQVSCTITCNASYTPNAGASGTDSFSYNVTDSSNAASATVTVNVTIVPNDVTAGIKVSGTGLVLNRATNVQSGTDTLTNISGGPIAEPLLAVFTGLPANITVVNAAGVVPSGPYAGLPYVTISGTSPLAPGAAVSFAVQFKSSGGPGVSYTLKTLSGGF